MQDRDRELLKGLRQLATSLTDFVERAETDETDELAFADGLGVLMRACWNTAEELSARGAALYATNPWHIPAAPGPASP